MSEDWYLVCKQKKLVMPYFTMGMGGIWQTDKRWVFDFIQATDRCKIILLHENSVVENWTKEKNGWRFINAWKDYEEPTKNILGYVIKPGSRALFGLWV